MQQNIYIPRRLLLQWHITNSCNLRCSHCYQEKYSGDEPDFQSMMYILKQYEDLLSLWRLNYKTPVKGHITITGGEPFLRKDFYDLLNVFYEKRSIFSFAILTNGTLIDRQDAEKISKLNPAFVQVSFEGDRLTHDKIRGQGSFDSMNTAVKHLVRSRVKTSISFTAHKGNFREFPRVAALGRKLRVNKVWSDRLIPSGEGENLSDLVPDPEETLNFINIMNKERKKARLSFFNPVQVGMNRALQFVVTGGRPYRCSAGDTLITVMPDGDLYPCRRMPVKVGNLNETSLYDLYYGSDLFWTLRDRKRVSSGCEGCSFSNSCRGGLKCLSYSMTGDPFIADPGCWLAKR
ncbi:MAG: radical SAM protein [Desulfobacterales bacterium]|jgi:radical SAM protein with 4Fe4S-binding SPASM domain|nr:radical SAM protein [Desulfobacteraceae bacterium]MBT7084632.1 radical SAM protein [Desulfobacterales bacterium]MBT7697402.1 radical SAM protein [Desulfobacterales bacterium]